MYGTSALLALYGAIFVGGTIAQTVASFICSRHLAIRRSLRAFAIRACINGVLLAGALETLRRVLLSSRFDGALHKYVPVTDHKFIWYSLIFGFASGLFLTGRSSWPGSNTPRSWDSAFISGLLGGAMVLFLAVAINWLLLNWNAPASGKSDFRIDPAGFIAGCFSMTVFYGCAAIAVVRTRQTRKVNA